MRRRQCDERMVDGTLPVDRSLSTSVIAAERKYATDDERKDERPPQEQRRDDGEHEPHDAEAADVRERDEERVERLGAMADDPALEALIEPTTQSGRICFAWSISCCGSNGLPTNADAPRSSARCGRTLVDLAAEHDHRDRAVPFLDALQHLPAVDARHHHVEQDQLRRLLALEHRHSLVGVARLEHRVALELEARAHVLAHAVVVVDDEHRRARPARARPGRSSRGTCRGRRAGSGGGRRACRRPARAPDPTICGSCSARRRGTSPPGRESASRARSQVLDVPGASR